MSTRTPNPLGLLHASLPELTASLRAQGHSEDLAEALPLTELLRMSLPELKAGLRVLARSEDTSVLADAVARLAAALQARRDAGHDVDPIFMHLLHTLCVGEINEDKILLAFASVALQTDEGQRSRLFQFHSTCVLTAKELGTLGVALGPDYTTSH